MPDLPVIPKVRTEPFRHVMADGLWDHQLLQAVLEEFPDPDGAGWKRYNGASERKLEGPPSLWGPKTWAQFGAMSMATTAIGEAFGLPGLQMETVGGGYHLIPPGGYLGVHTDFNRSSKSHLYRRLNMLIYLNHGWDDDGGLLELWDDEGPVAEIAPEFGRTVIFETSDHSWHGHPVQATRWRRSIAAYFFSADPPPGYAKDHSTIWHPRADWRVRRA